MRRFLDDSRRELAAAFESDTYAGDLHARVADRLERWARIAGVDGKDDAR